MDKGQQLGQLSVEATMVFIVVMIAIVAILFVLPFQFAKIYTLDDRRLAQQTVEKIASEADFIYFIGEGGIKEVRVTIPPSIDYTFSYIGSLENIEDWNLKKEIRITLKDGQVISSTTTAPICGSFPLKIGENKIKIQYNSSGVPHVMINSNC
ncbi:MAG: hypothetical protein QXV83_01620 [Candidatus Anstonellaceae archaeon]